MVGPIVISGMSSLGMPFLARTLWSDVLWYTRCLVFSLVYSIVIPDASSVAYHMFHFYLRSISTSMGAVELWSRSTAYRDDSKYSVVTDFTRSVNHSSINLAFRAFLTFFFCGEVV